MGNFFLFLIFTCSLFSCETLFQFCDQFTRPFSILVLYPEDEHLCFTLARKYPQAVIIMVQQDIGIDNKKASALLEKCIKQKDLTNLILVSGQINAQDAREIVRCEHFDGIICPTTPFEMTIPLYLTTQEVIDLLLQASPNLFFKGQLYKNNKPTQIFKGLLFRAEAQNKEYAYSPSQMITYGQPISSSMQHGIAKCPGLSLISFLTFKGIWPDPQEIKKLLLCPEYKKFYPRATPWNTIISGNTLHFEIPPDKTLPTIDPLAPTLWEIFSPLFECRSKRELCDLIQFNYFD